MPYLELGEFDSFLISLELELLLVKVHLLRQNEDDSLVGNLGLVTFLLKLTDLGLTDVVFAGLAPCVVMLYLGLEESDPLLICLVLESFLVMVHLLRQKGVDSLVDNFGLVPFLLDFIGLTVDLVFFGLAPSLLKLVLLERTEMFLFLLELALSFIELDLLGLMEVIFVFLGLALSLVEQDILGLTEVDFVFLGLALCLVELDLLGLKEVDFLLLGLALSLVELNLLGLTEVGSRTVLLGLTPCLRSPTLLGLMGVASMVVFPGDVTSSTAPGVLGLRGIGSLVLSFELSFSNLGFLGFTVQVSVSVHGSGIASVLLACE